MKLRKKRQQGFTLIEVLVSMSLFAVGMLGIALYLAKGLQTTVNNEAHAMAMRVAQQAVEPLYVASNQSRASLKTALEKSTTNPFPFTYHSALASQFNITIDATDRDNKKLLQNKPEDWKPPFTVVLNVEYDDGHNTLHFDTAHVLVPPPGS